MEESQVFEVFISTLIYWGNACDEINLITDDIRCSLGLNPVLHVNSLILRKPKRARVNAVQIISLSECDLGKSMSNMATVSDVL